MSKPLPISLIFKMLTLVWERPAILRTLFLFQTGEDTNAEHVWKWAIGEDIEATGKRGVGGTLHAPGQLWRKSRKGVEKELWSNERATVSVHSHLFPASRWAKKGLAV